MDVKIESGIPIPSKYTNDTRKFNFLDDMSIGDSVFMSVGNYKNIETLIQSVRGVIWRKHKTSTKRFTTRVVNKDGQQGVRIWRIEDNK